MTRRAFSMEQARAIRLRFARDPGLTCQRVADDHGVVVAVIANLVAGRTYADVGGPLRPAKATPPMPLPTGGYARHELRAMTPEQVVEIRDRYANDPQSTLYGLAVAYKCNHNVIRNIVTGRTYADVGGRRSVVRPSLRESSRRKGAA